MRKRFGLRWLLSTAAVLAFPLSMAAQGTEPAQITGEVTDETGAPISGVQVVIVNQSTGFQSGALTQANGRFLVVGLRPGGPYRIEARMIGYGLEALDDVILEAGGTFEANFALGTEAIALDALEVFSTRAIERKTPVAYTDVPKVQIQNQLGSRDLPMVLNVTPSVYATQQGGGAGDARINVRGFNQRNTAIMINGVPVNDMENGWVYWSNWDGLGDAARSVQLQRGLSAVNLATPSIGGTLNIITDATEMAPGIGWKQEFGSGNFLKETFSFATGEFKNKFAFSGAIVRKTGDGIYGGGRFATNAFGGDAAWTDAWAYYVAGSFQINPTNRLELYAVGAPQRHGQNLYKLNIGTLSHNFARGLKTYDPAALEKYEEAGLEWSPNVNRVNPSYRGKQYTSSGPGGSGKFSRYAQNYINERENYFHKPQVNLNWYSYFGNNLTLSTVAYYSGGNGGGTGTYGSSSRASWNYQYTQRVPDWDGTIQKNIDRGSDGSGYILRNSVNNQWTIGAISKLRKDFEGGLTAEVGLDWRTAEIDHYREVRDLLGGEFYIETYDPSDFWGAGEEVRRLGDKIDYDNTNQVNWLGAYVQAERSNQNGSIYGMVGWAQNEYEFTDYWQDDPNKSGLQPLKVNSGKINGYQIKGGASRNLTDEITVFANGGYVSKVPIFDGVIDDRTGALNEDPKNEKFTSFEGGMTYRSQDRAISFDVSAYYTKWQDRTYNLFVRNLAGDNVDGLVNLLGLDARHMGIELMAAYQPYDFVRLDAAASFGNWEYLNDVTGTYKPDEAGSTTESYEFYVEGLKVADAPQSQLAYAVSFFPTQNFYIRGQGRTYWDYYSEFDPFDRTQISERGIQTWSPPGYTVVDLHASYRLGDLFQIWNGGDLRFFANVYNLLDEMYISDSVDNSSYNGFDKDHDADDAEVFLGQPRFFNIGFEVKF